MSGDRRALHLVRDGGPGPEGDAGPGSVHPLPAPEKARPGDWDRLLDLIFDHDVTVIW